MKCRTQLPSQAISQETAENAGEKARQANSQQNISTNSNSSGPKTPTHGPKRHSNSSTNGSSSINTAGMDEVDRKRKVIKCVPILNYMIKEALCEEAELINTMRMVCYRDGDYIFRQGATEKDIYFIAEGKVIITRKRLATSANRSLRHATVNLDLEMQILTHRENECFGEVAFLQNAARNSNAIAEGNVTCMILDEETCRTLLAPVHQLLLYRYQLRFHNVLEKNRMFKEQLPTQREYIIDHCTLENFEDGTFICKQGEVEDKFYIVVQGEVKIVSEELSFDDVVEPVTSPLKNSDEDPQPNDGDTGGGKHPSLTKAGTLQLSSAIVLAMEQVRPLERLSTGIRITMNTLALRTLYEGFGEMGLLGKPRSEHAIAIGKVLCIVITRRVYVAACQMLNNLIDADAESLLAMSLTEEWKLVKNAQNLHISNPRVAHYLVTFIKKFKASYNQTFVGRTIYLDFLRRLHMEALIAVDFDSIVSRIDWNSPSSSLSIIRSETRRILSSDHGTRTMEEMSFIGRMIEATTFLNKFEMPGTINKFKVARQLGRAMEFLHIRKDVYLFRQGKIESKAYVILRGKINIVSEDINTNMSAVKHHDVIATLSAGDSFGELSLVTNMQRSASAVAASDSDLMVLDRTHIKSLQAALPGVHIRHVMVERAEFLSKLNFFKGADFGHRIRVAHDIQEQMYEPRHVFLQEPTHLRALYIVKRGEIAVFHKRKLLPHQKDRAVESSKNVATTQYTHGLIRVATIGTQEFFGMGILNANIAFTAHGTIESTTVPAVNVPIATGSINAAGTTAAANHACSSETLYSIVYMCSTRCQVLELSERGWRRLDMNTLAKIRNALIERNRYNLVHVASQKEKDISYFHPEKPWQLIVPGEKVATKVEERHPTQLVQQLYAKEVERHQYSHFFSSDLELQSPSKVATRSKKFEEQQRPLSPSKAPASPSNNRHLMDPFVPSLASPKMKSVQEISQSFAAVTLKNAPSLTSVVGISAPSSIRNSLAHSPIAPPGSPNTSKSRWNGRLSGSFMGSFMTVPVVKEKEQVQIDKSLQNITEVVNETESKSCQDTFLSMPGDSQRKQSSDQPVVVAEPNINIPTVQNENETRMDENTAMWRATQKSTTTTTTSTVRSIR